MEIKTSLDRRTVQHVCEGVPRELKKVVAGGSACPEGPGGGLTPSRGGDPKQVEDVGRLLGPGRGRRGEGVGGGGAGPELLHGGGLLLHQLLRRLLINVAATIGCGAAESTENKTVKF